jgi:hypothetical protein
MHDHLSFISDKRSFLLHGLAYCHASCTPRGNGCENPGTIARENRQADGPPVALDDFSMGKVASNMIGLLAQRPEPVLRDS